LILCII